MRGVFLLMELSVAGVFGYLLYAGHAGLLSAFSSSFLAISAFGVSAISYITGNGMLLNQSKPYLRRLELNEVRPLRWIHSIQSQKRLELSTATLDTPQLFVERLMYWRKQIDNVSMHSDIDKIIRLFHLMEERDVMEAEKFLVRHSTVVNVLMQYDALENSKLNNLTTRESKTKLESVLRKAAEAIEQEVTDQFQMGLLDVSAETDVYLQTLKSRNLLKE